MALFKRLRRPSQGKQNHLTARRSHFLCSLRHSSVVPIAVIGLSCFVGSGTAGGALAIADLRCEYLQDPQGIDAIEPRLSWVLESDQRAQRQSAYQVLVASSHEKLAEDKGDLWDSGRVESDRSIQVRYAGRPLASREACFWRVRVWDQEGQASSWSQPADDAEGVEFLRMEDGRAVFRVDSGDYHFVSRPGGTP